MQQRLLNIITDSAQTLSCEKRQELIKFVSESLKTATPSRKGWQERLIPSLVQKWIEQRVEAEEKAYYSSEEYKKRRFFEWLEEREKTLKLEIGESLIYKGASLYQNEGYIKRNRLYSKNITNDEGHWIGLDYYSHSEGRTADRFFIPDGMKIKVELLYEGCAHSFQVCRITRIKRSIFDQIFDRVE